METNKVIVQRIKKEVNGSYVLAEKYYSFLSELNGLNLTKREIQLLAFTAIRGNITNGNVREEFCKKYETTSPTINNIISKLRRMGVLVKDGKMTRVNPKILLDFNRNIVLQITLEHKHEGTVDKGNS